MQNEVKQFNSISEKYSSFVDIDPVRNKLHYPNVINYLGNIKDKMILDIGCGDGLFDRRLVKETGANIVGYDKGDDLISIAKKEELNNPQGINYYVDDPITFKNELLFDYAVSIMVLCYAPSEEYLKYFFDSAYKSLKVNGQFVSVTFNPNFKSFNSIVANRIFKIIEGNKIEANFLNPETKIVNFTSELSQYSTKDYEESAKNSGFIEFEWKQLFPNKDENGHLGSNFWKSCIEFQPYSIFIAKK